MTRRRDVAGGAPPAGGLRVVAVLVLAAATYGAGAGLVHGPVVAARNVVKFPALLLATATLCGLAWFASAQLLARGVGLRDAARSALRTFRDASLLLASLTPITVFLAVTMDRPVSTTDLREYPLVLGVQVLFVATAGSVALVRQTVDLKRRHRLGAARATVVVAVWLVISLFVGGQCAWYLRPFYGPSYIEDPPWMEGSRPHVDGSRSFYEAVWHLVRRDR